MAVSRAQLYDQRVCRCSWSFRTVLSVSFSISFSASSRMKRNQLLKKFTKQDMRKGQRRKTFKSTIVQDEKSARKELRFFFVQKRNVSPKNRRKKREEKKIGESTGQDHHKRIKKRNREVHRIARTRTNKKESISFNSHCDPVTGEHSTTVRSS